MPIILSVCIHTLVMSWATLQKRAIAVLILSGKKSCAFKSAARMVVACVACVVCPVRVCELVNSTEYMHSEHAFLNSAVRVCVGTRSVCREGEKLVRPSQQGLRFRRSL